MERTHSPIIIFLIFLCGYCIAYMLSDTIFSNLPNGLKSSLFYAAFAVFPVIVLLGYYGTTYVCSILLCFLYFRIHDVVTILHPLSIPKLLGQLTFLFLAIHLFMGNRKLYWCREMKWIVLFCSLATLSAFTSFNVEAGTDSLEILISILITLYAAILIFDRPTNIHFLFSLIMLSGLLLSSVITYTNLTADPFTDRFAIGKELESFLADPNDLASILILPLCTCLGFIILDHKNLVNRILAFTCFPLILYTLFNTKSRGGILATIAIFLLFAYDKIKNKMLFLIIAISVTSLILIVSGISSRHADINDGALLDDSAMNRLYAWEAGFRMAVRHPLFGVGPGNFVDHFHQSVRVWTGKSREAHSTWFSILGQTGFIGCGLYITFIVTALKKIRHCMHKLNNPQNLHYVNPDLLCFSTITYAGFIGILVTYSFLSHEYFWELYTTIALIIILSRFVESSTK